MLPMNLIMEDIAEFVKRREEEVMGTPVGHEDVQKQRDEIVLFANELSEKYEELVSVELVDTLMVSYQDSVDTSKDLVMVCENFEKDTGRCKYHKVLAGTTEDHPTGADALSGRCLAKDRVNNWSELGKVDCNMLCWSKEKADG